MTDPGDRRYARVAVDVTPAHLDRPFDYAIPPGAEVRPGQRVRVVFAGRRRTAWVLEVADTSQADPARVRPLSLVQGERIWFDDEDLRLYRWVAQRWGASLADVLRHALPSRVAAVEREADTWPSPPPPSPSCDDAADRAWEAYDAAGLFQALAGGQGSPAFWLRPLPGDDPTTLVPALVRRCLAHGRTALVLAPDGSAAVLDAVLRVAGAAGADLRAGTPRDRYRAFLRCRDGVARVAVGERGAVFAPLRDLGLVVVDDEANPAYKERRSPRHNARDVALARARMAGAAAVALSDLPSPQLWRLLEGGHVARVAVDRGSERARSPRIEVLDMSDPKPGTRRARFAEAAAHGLSQAVREGGAAVVLAARGGQGAALGCRACRRRLPCPVCDGSVRPQRAGEDWECPSCGWNGPPFACPDCQDTRNAPLVAGAGRLAAELARSHPQAEVVRMEGFDAPGPSRRPAIAVMTRGSVVTRPGWLGEDSAALLVLPDADGMLSRPALEAGEDALRLWMAAARWTNRVLLQTREPGHPAVQALVRWDPEGFWRQEAGRRAELGYPPARSLIRLSAPSAAVAEVAAELSQALPEADDLLGPDLDGVLLVKTPDLRGTLAVLTPLRHAWGKANRKVRVDVDPVAAG